MTRAPILVVGVTQRSGTNYLHELLRLHPDLAAPRRILEDYLTAGADQLADGVREITRRYMPEWIAPHEAEAQLLRRVGDALLDWLAEDAGLAPDDARRLLTKSPGAFGVRGLAALAPGAHLVLLVRDGRDVTASGMRGLGWRFTEGLDTWLAGAREFLRLTGRPLPLGVQVRTVRYEDVVADPVGEVTDLLRWLDLDPDRWDAAAARSLPVVGSSFHTGGAEHVHWAPLDRPDDFDPRGRAADWPDELHARFVLRASTELRAFGYPAQLPPAGVATGRAAAREAVRGVRRTARWLLGEG